jgi:hypothetical protein
MLVDEKSFSPLAEIATRGVFDPGSLTLSEIQVLAGSALPEWQARIAAALMGV